MYLCILLHRGPESFKTNIIGDHFFPRTAVRKAVRSYGTHRTGPTRASFDRDRDLTSHRDFTMDMT